MITLDKFRAAMAAFPSGVSIVTTVDETGGWTGFTASSFCSLSADPPLVLVCLAKSAACHDVFRAAARWNIHFVDEAATEAAMRFAERGADKFGTGEFEADRHGLPRLASAFVTLSCMRDALHDSGDHTILVGEVDDISMREGAPVYYYNRGFHAVS